jgi:hypothetical protein
MAYVPILTRAQNGPGALVLPTVTVPLGGPSRASVRLNISDADYNDPTLVIDLLAERSFTAGASWEFFYAQRWAAGARDEETGLIPVGELSETPSRAPYLVRATLTLNKRVRVGLDAEVGAAT